MWKNASTLSLNKNSCTYHIWSKLLYFQFRIVTLCIKKNTIAAASSIEAIGWPALPLLLAPPTFRWKLLHCQNKQHCGLLYCISATSQFCSGTLYWPCPSIHPRCDRDTQSLYSQPTCSGTWPCHNLHDWQWWCLDFFPHSARVTSHQQGNCAVILFPNSSDAGSITLLQ